MLDYAISNENWRLLNNSSIKMLQLAVSGIYIRVYFYCNPVE